MSSVVLTPGEESLVRELRFDATIVLDIKRRVAELDEWSGIEIRRMSTVPRFRSRSPLTDRLADGIVITFDIERPTMDEAAVLGDWSAFWAGLERLRAGERVVFDRRTALREAGYQMYVASDGTTGPYAIGLVRSPDRYAPVRYAGTDGANYGLTTEDIVATLRSWEAFGSFDVMAAGGTGAMLFFSRLPDDPDSFVETVRAFCPDAHAAVPPHLYSYREAMIRDTRGETVESMEITDAALRRILLDTGRVYLWWD